MIVAMPLGAALGFFGYWEHRRVQIPAGHVAAYAAVSALMIASTLVINPAENALLAVAVAAWAGAIVRLRGWSVNDRGPDWLVTAVSAALLAAVSPITSMIGLFLGEALRSGFPGVVRSSTSALAITTAPALALGSIAARLFGLH
ncbi:hypothetical protein [Arthrobacter sp. A2-55]|uniref:hypothetical protein n=1 Tax=Arthrobacter sp. A2-55 TaxID=2897337 RepID=UPI0021CD455A|nr:hypothetical protein [Arthrobacter sp. A2-55]MCU6480163.1 hypothetical protein [Arthrobacter sp. A2-55]